MELETVTISGFRSIQSVTLFDCGGFNVLIGKNNAGKSNILLAINLFFAALRQNQPVLVWPHNTTPLDHHGGDGKAPFHLTLDFRLTLAERDSLIQDIVADAPQVKNAVEGLDPNLRLGVTLSFISEPEPFSYVKELFLHTKQFDDKAQADPTIKLILKVDDLAAKELAGKANAARHRENDADYIKEYISRLERYVTGQDEWERIKADPSRLRRMFSLETRGATLLRQTENKFEQLIRSSDTKITFKEAAESLITSILTEAKDLRSQKLENRIDTISGKESSIPPYALNVINRVAKLKLLFLRERREPIGVREANQLLDLKVTRGGPEKLRAIQETVEALLGVEIDAFKSSSREESPAELDVDRFLVQMNGAGVREALRLILDYEFQQPNILLVEEPEVHLHPALEISMMRYLKKTGQDCQIFITTHSTNFLDTAEMRNVYLVSKNGSTKVQLVSSAEAETAIPRELGIRLSSLFMFDRLIFVEGPTDEDVLREWATTLDVNLAHASVGFVAMGGVRNLAHFAVDQTISFLTKRRVFLLFILDHDERGNAEIEKITRALGKQASLNVLQKRELENYLIKPRPIAEFVKLKRQLSGIKDAPRPTDQEVSTAINECADALKEKVIDLRVVRWACAPIYANRQKILDHNLANTLRERLTEELQSLQAGLAAKIDVLNEKIIEQQVDLENSWQMAKTDLVPGDVLLDEVCKRFDVRFVKDKDSVRLAKLMTRDEIAPEIRDILQNIQDKAV